MKNCNMNLATNDYSQNSQISTAKIYTDITEIQTHFKRPVHPSQNMVNGSNG